MLRRLALALIAVAALTGCGDDSSGGQAEEGTEPAQTQTETTEASTESEAEKEAAEARRAEKADRAREKRILRFYRGSGGASRWSIKSVEVDGGEVTVKTELFPKESNQPFFVGACTTLIGLYDWIDSVKVEGLDDTGHASWSKDDAACQTQGIG